MHAVGCSRRALRSFSVKHTNVGKNHDMVARVYKWSEDSCLREAAALVFNSSSDWVNVAQVTHS